MKKRNRRKPKNAIKKRNTQLNGNYYAREFQKLDRKMQSYEQKPTTLKSKKAQSECINEYFKRIYEKYGTFLKNRSNHKKQNVTKNPILKNPNQQIIFPRVQ